MINYPENIDRILNVRSDLLYLKNDWNNQIDDHSLRRSSIVIRRLVVEKEFGKAWRDLGHNKEPTIEAPSIMRFIGDIDINRVRFAQAGGATYKSMQIEAIIEFMDILTPQEIKEIRKHKLPPVESNHLTSFLESPTIVVNGSLISRRVLIKYIAYKLGGVHPVNRKRNVKTMEDHQFKLLDHVNSSFQIAEKNAIYFELLSIGQCLVSSPDTKTYIEESRKYDV